MKIGLLAPQGWKGEYDGWDPAAAWARTVELAVQAEELGFESLWVFDHFHTVPVPTDEMTLESFSVLSALAMVTRRVRLGHMVDDEQVVLSGLVPGERLVTQSDDRLQNGIVITNAPTAKEQPAS